jgi:hypothetical protein
MEPSFVGMAVLPLHPFTSQVYLDEIPRSLDHSHAETWGDHEKIAVREASTDMAKSLTDSSLDQNLGGLDHVVFDLLPLRIHKEVPFITPQFLGRIWEHRIKGKLHARKGVASR